MSRLEENDPSAPAVKSGHDGGERSGMHRTFLRGPDTEAAMAKLRTRGKKQGGARAGP
jgi:hypothetical protein